jgi:hypothetical protein
MSFLIGGYTIAESRLQNIALNNLLGAYELALPLYIDIRPTGEKCYFELFGGRVHVSTQNGGNHYLGFAHVDGNCKEQTFDFLHPTTPCLTLRVIEKQLSSIEDLRGGGSLYFEIDLRGEFWKEGQSHQVQDKIKFDVPSSKWIEVLKSARFMDFISIQIPMPFSDVPTKLERVFRIPCHWHSLNIQHVV